MPTTHRTISLRELRAFCVAAEHESFREAANRLFLTASAISHQIKHLEEELDRKLFTRTSRAIQLTDAGKQLYDDLQPVIRNLDAVVSRHGAPLRRTVLKISVQPFFASELFVPRLQEFRELHPEIEIKVDTSDESAEKHPGNVDLSIRIFKTPPANLKAQRLFPLRLIPAGSKRFRDTVRVRNESIVSDFPLIVHDTRPKAWSKWSKSSGISLPKDPGVIRLDSMIAVARAAEKGLGAALVPLQLSDAWFADDSLVTLFDAELETNDAYYVVCDESATSNYETRVFRDWVLQTFGDST